MVQTYISSEHEVYEVLNQFPVLEEVFKELRIDISSIEEYVSIESFLKTKDFLQEEISLIVSKLNGEISHFLNHGTLMQPKVLKQVHEVLDIEMIH